MKGVLGKFRGVAILAVASVVAMFLQVMPLPFVPSSALEKVYAQSPTYDGTETICFLCGQPLEPEYVSSENGTQVLNEKHHQVWIHNPRYLHEDVKVDIHEGCYLEVKAIFPSFDKPTQLDYANPMLPKINAGGSISLFPLSEELVEGRITGSIARVNVGAVAKVNGGNMVPGEPAGAQSNDILIVFCEQRDNVVSTMSGDWTQIYGVNNGASSRASAWWCRRGAGAPSYTITRAGGDSGIAVVVTYRGCEVSGNPIDAYGTANSNNSKTVNYPSVTTSKSNCMLLFICHAADNGNNTVVSGADPAPVEFLDDNTNLGSDSGLAADDGIKVGVGSSGARTSTYSLAQYHIGATIALKAYNSSLISFATGNFTAATTWEVVDGTSLLDSEAGNTALTVSYVSSSNITPGAITIDGIAVKVASRAASPTGNVSVQLYNSTDSVAVPGTEVIILVSDLPTCSTTEKEGGWHLFKLGAPVLLEAAHNYQVQARTSSASQVNLYRDSTANNWARMLRTTTTQAPAAGDVMHVIGEHTGAGARNDFVVTMNSTANTDYGTGTDASTALTVGQGGTLNYDYVAATNYYLKLSGNLIVYNGGTFTVGTVANPIPRDGSAVLEFDPVADGGMGLIARNGSAVTMQGLSRTVGKNVVSGKLILDTVNGESHFHLDTDSGWLNGDVVGIASTTRTYTQCETKILNGNAGVEICDVTVAFGATVHHGISPTQAEVILLTRNVKVRSATSTIMTYFNAKATAMVDIDWVEFYYLGEANISKYGITIETTTGSFNIQYSSLHNTEDAAIYPTGSAVNNFTVSSCVLYGCCSTSGVPVVVPVTTGTSWIIDSDIVMLVSVYGNACFNFGSLLGTVTNNTAIGAYSDGFNLNATVPMVCATFSGNAAHSNSRYGFNLNYLFNSIFSNLTSWRNSSSGLSLNSCRGITIDTMTLFGNYQENINFSGSCNIYLLSFVANGDTTFSTTYGINIGSGSSMGGTTSDIFLESCDFGTPAGAGANARTAHTNDINIGSGNFGTFQLSSTILASGVEVTGISTAAVGSYVKSQKLDQTAGNHWSWFKYGTISIDSSENYTAPPSQRLTPSNAANKLESGSKFAALANGTNATFSVYVKESVAYNGNPARLVLKKNVAAGIAADAVLDTVAGGVGAWEQLTGTTASVTDNCTLEVVVDCDGTVGYVNVDDWSDPPECVNPNGGETYWFVGLPHTGIKKQAEEGETYWSSGLPALHLYPVSGAPDIINAPSSYDYGVVATSAIQSTGLDYFAVTNNSGFSVNITIGGTDMTGGISWTLSDDGNPGADIVGFKAGLDGGDYTIVVRKNAPYNTLVAGLGDGLSQKWGLRIYVPTSFSDGVEKSGTVTLTAVAS